MNAHKSGKNAKQSWVRLGVRAQDRGQPII
jgi:hypothetical protein